MLSMTNHAYNMVIHNSHTPTSTLNYPVDPINTNPTISYPFMSPTDPTERPHCHWFTNLNEPQPPENSNPPPSNASQKLSNNVHGGKWKIQWDARKNSTVEAMNK